jgi:hypothetical protein
MVDKEAGNNLVYLPLDKIMQHSKRQNHDMQESAKKLNKLLPQHDFTQQSRVTSDDRYERRRRQGE